MITREQIPPRAHHSVYDTEGSKIEDAKHYDVVLAFRDQHGNWGHAGLGTLILLLNIVLIWAYTFSCHSCRHIVGGRLKHFSQHPVRYRLWSWAGKLNARHMQLAWASLISVAVADFYVYLVASGAFDDPRFF
jgi:hypothetical protein